MKMKKKKGVVITILILAMLWVIGMTGCQKKTEKVVEDIGESSVFTKEEREDAIKCVRDNFSFEGTTLKIVDQGY